MRRTLTAALVLALLAFPARAQDMCGSSYAADPAALASVWVPSLERLYAAIPSLSPKEEQWLQQEMRGDGQRPVRAVSSREYAMQQAKLNAGSLLGSIRRLTEKRDGAEQTRGWMLFAYTLIESDASIYLSRLVEERVIQREALPDEWTVFASGTFPLKEAIRQARTSLARHVLICTLPTVMGLSLSD